ncbi:hypothetical protein HDV05_007312 [Chytridiales sp. JEL 0842]|nr:hypothetical protein HDV05_007312 [Chytridiales sp. JEL 0842]
MFRAAPVARRFLNVQRRFASSTPSTSNAGAFDPAAPPSSWPSLKDIMLPEAYHARQHAKGTTSFWLKFNLFFTAPVMVVASYMIIPKEIEHIHHIEEHPLQWQAYPYMRKRKNEFPWGDLSLFHNDSFNPQPE